MAKKSSVKKAVKKTAKKPVKKAAKKAAKVEVKIAKVVKKATEVAVKTSTKKATTTPPKTPKSTIEKNTSRYINSVPKTIPAGKILCHGGVIPQTPDQKPALNGFRPWIDDDAKSEKYGPCNCGWSGLPHHMPLSWLEGSRKEYDARKFPRK